MMMIGLILAVAASGCCAYLTGLAVERWMTWPKPHGWPWAILITGVMTAVNVGVVAAAAHRGTPFLGGGLVVMMQVQALIVLPVVFVGLGSQIEDVSAALVGFHIGFLAVQLVGARLALAEPAMTFEASLWWLGCSLIALSRVALAGQRQGQRWRDARRDSGLIGSA